MAVSFIGGGNHVMLYREHLKWAGLELTTMLMKDTGCISSCKSNCHTIMTTTVPYVISILFLFNKLRRQSKMDNPEKRATPGTQTQDDDKQSKNTAQYYVGQQYGQATTNKVNKT